MVISRKANEIFKKFRIWVHDVGGDMHTYQRRGFRREHRVVAMVGG